MKKICSVYLRNSRFGPSDYYRVVQYIEQLGGLAEFKINNALNDREFQKNLDMEKGLIKKLYQLFLYVKILKRRSRALREDLCHPPDIIIIQREIFPQYMPVLIKRAIQKLFQKTTIIWDFDDNIFLNGEISKREKDLLILYSNHIIGLGKYAISLLPDLCREKFIMMPTTDSSFCEESMQELMQKRILTYQNEMRIVWVGTVSNIINIDIVIEKLDEAAIFLKKKGKKVVLSLVCNIPYVSSYLCKTLIIENIKWSRENAKYVISKAHLGIMPLIDNQYAQGKGGFKLIQYLESGLPVISSDVGFCREVIGEGCGYLVPNDDRNKWYEIIIKVGTEQEVWQSKSNNARKQYLDKFNLDNNLNRWRKLIENG